MELGIYHRSLVASYLYKGKVLAWQCTLCGKIFSRSVTETERDCNGTRPEHIRCEFQNHSCEAELLQLVKKHEAGTLDGDNAVISILKSHLR